MKRFRVRSLLSLGFLTCVALGATVAVESSAAAYNGCYGGDCIVYDLSTQDTCSEVTAGASGESRWARGLSLDADRAIKGGHIAAYRIQWSSGGWSGWFIPGVNDIDYKFNAGLNTLRRMWSYFYDHNHSYILCTKTPGAY